MNQTITDLKLTSELVPATAWRKNLRTNVTRSLWDKIRYDSYQRSGNKCGICGAEGQLQCHEIWDYDDENHVQKLSGFIALCRDCHQVKHIGRSGILAMDGKLDFDHLIDHFCKVNNCSKKIFDKHQKQVSEKWRQRSKYPWQCDFGEYEESVKTFNENKSKRMRQMREMGILPDERRIPPDIRVRVAQGPQDEGKRGAQIPWNKGLVGVQVPWNKELKGVQVPWNKGLKGVQVPWNKGRKGVH